MLNHRVTGSTTLDLKINPKTIQIQDKNRADTLQSNTGILTAFKKRYQKSFNFMRFEGN